MSNTTPTAPRICDECEADETTEKHAEGCRFHPENSDWSEECGECREAISTGNTSEQSWEHGSACSLYPGNEADQGDQYTGPTYMEYDYED